MALPAQKTLGDLTTKLAVRCGYGAAGIPTGIQKAILEDFLQDAQEQLAEQYEDILLTVVNTTDPGTTQSGQTLYDFPDDCDPYRIKVFAVQVGGQWIQLDEGIHVTHRSFTQSSYPTRYMLRLGTSEQGQIEIWPEPAAAYPLFLQYVRRLRPFEQETDQTTLPWRLVFLFALATAKAHYGQPDSQFVGNQLTAMLRRLKRKQHENKRYFKTGFDSRGGHPLFGPKAHEWIEQAGKTIVDIDVLLSQQGDFLSPQAGSL